MSLQQQWYSTICCWQQPPLLPSLLKREKAKRILGERKQEQVLINAGSALVEHRNYGLPDPDFEGDLQMDKEIREVAKRDIKVIITYSLA